MRGVAPHKLTAGGSGQRVMPDKDDELNANLDTPPVAVPGWLRIPGFRARQITGNRRSVVNGSGDIGATKGEKRRIRRFCDKHFDGFIWRVLVGGLVGVVRFSGVSLL